MLKKLLNSLKGNIEKNRISAVIISVFSFILILLFSLTTIYQLFELKLYDVRFRLKPAPPQWEFLSLINIDDNSIKNIGEYPWPRNIYAEGINTLKDIGIRQAIFDVQFMDESPKYVKKDNLGKIQKKISRGERISNTDLNNTIIDNDIILAGSIKSFNKTILPYSFMKEKLNEPDIDEKTRQDRAAAISRFTEKASVAVPKEKLASFKALIDPDRIDIQYPISPLSKSANYFGYVDSNRDIDGIERKIRLVRIFNGRIYFHLSMAVLLDLCDVKKENVKILLGDKIVLKDALNPITLKKEDMNIPIDNEGMMHINWAGEFLPTFRHLSFLALVEYNKAIDNKERDTIYSEFEEYSKNTGKPERGALFRALSKKYDEFYLAKDPSVKRSIRDKIQEIQKMITNVESDFNRYLNEETEDIKLQLKKNPGLKELKEKLEYIQVLKSYIELVTSVERLKNYSAIIGFISTASQTQDIGVTPVSHEYFMVGTYPNIVNTILQKQFIKKAHPAINYLVMLLIAVIMGLVVQKLNAIYAVITTILSFIIVNLATILIFAFAQTWLDQLGISLALLLPAVSIASVKFVSEESQKRFIKSAFSHYLSPRVIDEIIKNPASLKLGGEKRQITIFFSDVQGFSTISEKLTAEELVHLLNDYLSDMTDIILKYDGTVDKYEGDAIMAFFGAPHFFEDHAVKACLAAVEMQERLKEKREQWKKEGRDELKVRMGLNTGAAVVGNMGSRTRMDYTVMGDSVNLASRLEGANKAFNTYTMISENTYEAAKDHIEARRLGLIRVVGKEEPIQVYEILGRKGKLTDQTLEMLAKYNDGYEYFRNKDWEKARNAFRAGLKIIREDGACKSYYDLCTEYMVTPPPKNWDGVYRLKSK